MKTLQKLVLSLLVCCLSLTGLVGTGVQKVSAKTQAGYYTIACSYTQYKEKVSYTKVGGTEFALTEHQLKVKSAGKVKNIVKSTSDFRSAVTNGTNIFYQIDNKVYSIRKDGKNKKLVSTWKDGYYLTGAYNDSLYYTFQYGEIDPESNTYRYNIKTKKSVVMFGNQAVTMQKGTIMLVSGLANDVSPVSLKIYDLKTKKATLLSKQQAGNEFLGNKVYFAKFINYDSKLNRSTCQIRYYNVNTKKITTVATIKGASYVTEYTAKGCYYLSCESDKFFYNYKTGTSVSVKR